MLSWYLKIRLILQCVILCICLSAKSLASTPPNPLKIYCRDSFAATWGQQLLEKFAPHVQIIKLSGQGLLTRLRLEGSDSPADILLGIDTTQVSEIAELNLAAQLSDQISHTTLPISWHSTLLIPLAYDYLTILIHGDHYHINTLNDLLNYKDVFIIPDPRTSTTGLEFLYWIQQTYGKQTVHFWQQFKSAIMTYPKGLSSSFALFSSSSRFMTIGYSLTTRYAASKTSAHDIKSQIIAGAPVQVYGVIVTPRGATHTLTTQITDYLRSANFQKTIIKQDCLYPAIGDNQPFDAIVTPLPSNLLPPPLLTVDEKAALIADWLKVYQ